MASPGPYRVIRRVLNDVENYNMSVVFFPGFDRFIPGFDRFTPGFDRFIPAGIPVTPPPPPPPPSPPLQSKCTLVNQMCIFCILKSLYFILFDINIFYLKQHLSIVRTNIFAAKIKLTPIQGWPCLIDIKAPTEHLNRGMKCRCIA